MHITYRIMFFANHIFHITHNWSKRLFPLKLKTSPSSSYKHLLGPSCKQYFSFGCSIFLVWFYNIFCLILKAPTRSKLQTIKNTAMHSNWFRSMPRRTRRETVEPLQSVKSLVDIENVKVGLENFWKCIHFWGLPYGKTSSTKYRNWG